MMSDDLVGIGRVVLTNRERPLFIEPMGLGLRGVTLHYAHEVRPETDYFADIPEVKLPADMLEITKLILNSKREHFEPAYLEDRYRTVLAEKLRDKEPKVSVRSSGGPADARNVVNLMDALKASLATAKPPAASKARAGDKRAGGKRKSCEREGRQVKAS